MGTARPHLGLFYAKNWGRAVPTPSRIGAVKRSSSSQAASVRLVVACGATGLLIAICALILLKRNPAAPSSFASSSPAASPTNGAAEYRLYSYEVVNVWPHDPDAFTQGLVFLDGVMFESTGLNGESTLRREIGRAHV